ncbi:hypothetical protein CSUB01_09539 [Colletotrichum sublineola]|uniref:Uncharacterized protein n=1 Tax=Colletotrichum sublineola TaxID=1173701 RepID=A0A066X1I1_COLSU|nr:hypothetical protein CSUB01_09539 [Colletotrichum sublineola]
MVASPLPRAGADAGRLTKDDPASPRCPDRETGAHVGSDINPQDRTERDQVRSPHLSKTEIDVAHPSPPLAISISTVRYDGAASAAMRAFTGLAATSETRHVPTVVSAFLPCPEDLG